MEERAGITSDLSSDFFGLLDFDDSGTVTEAEAAAFYDGLFNTIRSSGGKASGGSKMSFSGKVQSKPFGASHQSDDDMDGDHDEL